MLPAEFTKESCKKSMMEDFVNYIAIVNMSQSMDDFTMRYWSANGIAQSMQMLGLISVKEWSDLTTKLFWDTWDHRSGLLHAREEAINDAKKLS